MTAQHTLFKISHDSILFYREVHINKLQLCYCNKKTYALLSFEKQQQFIHIHEI